LKWLWIEIGGVYDNGAGAAAGDAVIGFLSGASARHVLSRVMDYISQRH